MLTYVDTNRIHPLKSYQIAYAMVRDGSSTGPGISYPIYVQIRLSINFIKLLGLTVSTGKIIANSCELVEDIHTYTGETDIRPSQIQQTNALYIYIHIYSATHRTIPLENGQCVRHGLWLRTICHLVIYLTCVILTNNTMIPVRLQTELKFVISRFTLWSFVLCICNATPMRLWSAIFVWMFDVVLFCWRRVFF